MLEDVKEGCLNWVLKTIARHSHHTKITLTSTRGRIVEAKSVRSPMWKIRLHCGKGSMLHCISGTVYARPPIPFLLISSIKKWLQQSAEQRHWYLLDNEVLSTFLRSLTCLCERRYRRRAMSSSLLPFVILLVSLANFVTSAIMVPTPVPARSTSINMRSNLKEDFTSQSRKRGLGEESKVSLAVGIGIGVPSLIASVIATYFAWQMYKNSEARRWCGLPRLFGRKWGRSGR